VLFVGTLDVEGREQLLRVQRQRMCWADDVSVESLAARTEGFTGADLASLCRHAGVIALVADIEAEAVTAAHFEQALLHIRPSTPESVVAQLRAWSVA
jgi:SpoVK/Ycf46/Vps4 family AAA+-type ATPase